MPDTEEGPDPNDIRRHAKRMHTEMQYRQKYRRFDFYKPNLKQLEFHNTIARERMLRAGNQQGKTHCAAAQMTMDALRLYPEWYRGRRFDAPPKIERPVDFLGWAASTTSLKAREGTQTKLLGDLMQSDGLGTGLIPLDNIVGKPAMARGIADFVDTVSLTREGGGKAAISFKTYEMGRGAFATAACDEVWLDEDIKGEPPVGGIYPECLARLTTTNGQIIVSMTPELGLSPVRRRFKSKHPGTVDILMTIDDALVSRGGHIPDERLPEILSQYKNETEIQTKVYGADMQGEGAVFITPREEITHNLDPVDVPPYWPWMWALDFRHSGSVLTGHPFAAVLGCWDRSVDRIYVMHAVRMLGLASEHVKAIRQNPMKEAPAAWPHDGGRGGSIVSGETIAAIYKSLGLAMRPTHATFPSGGYDFEAGITEMETRFASKRLLIARHLQQAFDEYQGYHRLNGLVIKVDDDIMSAIRVLCMDIRFAKTTRDFHAVLAREAGSGSATFAIGTVNHPGGDIDVFTGT
jgi:phage terminase large subunit-like protein